MVDCVSEEQLWINVQLCRVVYEIGLYTMLGMHGRHAFCYVVT